MRRELPSPLADAADSFWPIVASAPRGLLNFQQSSPTGTAVDGGRPEGAIHVFPKSKMKLSDSHFEHIDVQSQRYFRSIDP